MPVAPRSRYSAYKKFLYRTLGWGVILALASPAVILTAQDEKPQIAPREKPKAKKDTEPRALGLLRLSSSGKATLVPIAILVNGKFYDAGAYKADPVPMALDSGTVYEAERSGDSLGLFTVNGASHSKDPGSQSPWLGAGNYLPHGSDAPRQGRKAEDVPVGMQKDEGPPRLTKSDKNKPADAPAGTGSPEKPGGTPSSTTPSSTPPSTAAPSTSAPSADSSSGSKPGEATAPASPDKPAGQTSDQTAGKTTEQTTAKAADPATTTPSKESPAQPRDESYRPTLRRGKPTQPLPDDDVTASKAAPKTGDGKAVTASAAASGPELIPAISDAGGPDPRSYKFEWRRGEEGDRHQQMLELAQSEFRAYLAKQAKATVGGKASTKAASAGHKAAAKQVQPVFENVQFRAFDVWGNNEAVIVFSADASMPNPPGSPTAAAEPNHYTMTLVARTDIYSNLHKLYVGITDKYHLDLTPRLDLIDVVDADGDGRGELLFHETSDAGSGYVIYRATADTLWKMFDSLRPE